MAGAPEVEPGPAMSSEKKATLRDTVMRKVAADFIGSGWDAGVLNDKQTRAELAKIIDDSDLEDTDDGLANAELWVRAADADE
jgi:hypothetical protein